MTISGKYISKSGQAQAKEDKQKKKNPVTYGEDSQRIPRFTPVTKAN
jgi:hypothetical protein